MELTPAIYDILVKTMAPIAAVTSRFDKATTWVVDDASLEVHRISLGTRWYLLTAKTSESHKRAFNDEQMVRGMVSLAERFTIESVEPYVQAGHTDWDLIALGIEQGIEPELLLSLNSDTK